MAFVGTNGIAKTTLFKILMGELKPTTGEVKWGITTSQSYLPNDNTEYFNVENMDLVEWLKLEIGHCMQENFLVIFLNQNNEIICYKTLFKGTLNASLVHPREIFKEAINIGCARIMCAHNHPSGKNEPSQADIEITHTLVECGKMMGIPLLDHIIISKSGYLSFKERMIID